MKWPKHHSNTAAIAVLDIPTMKCRILVKKLGFLRRLMEGDPDSLCGSVVLPLCDEVESICLVRECRGVLAHISLMTSLIRMYAALKRS